MFGINREFHYKFGSRSDRDELGRRLSPLSSWGSWGGVLETDIEKDAPDSPEHSGLLSITMRQMNMKDRESGWLDVTIASAGLTPDDIGVTARVNDHYQFSTEHDPDSLSADGHVGSRTMRLLDNLVNNFDVSTKRSDAIIQGLLTP